MSDCKVMAVANQKGGTAKTTTMLNLGIGLAKQGKKVLLVEAKNLTNLLKYLIRQMMAIGRVSIKSYLCRSIYCCMKKFIKKSLKKLDCVKKRFSL